MGRVLPVVLLQIFTYFIIVASFLVLELNANQVSLLTAEPTSNLSPGSQTHVEAGSDSDSDSGSGSGLSFVSNLWSNSIEKMSSVFSSISSMVYAPSKTTVTTEPQSNKTIKEALGKQPETEPEPLENKSEIPNSAVESVAKASSRISKTVVGPVPEPEPEPAIIVTTEEITTSQIISTSRTTESDDIRGRDTESTFSKENLSPAERLSSTTMTTTNSHDNAISVVALKTVIISSLIVNLILVSILIALIMYDRRKCSKLEMRICILTNEIMKDHFEGDESVYSSAE